MKCINLNKHSILLSVMILKKIAVLLVLALSTLYISACSYLGPESKKSNTMNNVINTQWELQAIEQQPIVASIVRKPAFKIIQDDAVYRFIGNDGCNRIFSQVEKINDRELKISGLVSTKMACRDMSISGRYSMLLAEVAAYELNVNTLRLTSSDGVELLRFMKK